MEDWRIGEMAEWGNGRMEEGTAGNMMRGDQVGSHYRYVKGWGSRNSIPNYREIDLLDAGTSLGIDNHSLNH